MSDKNLAPYVRIRELDANGNPLAGGKLYTYRNGTSTPKQTYSDGNGTANANPVVLDSEGSADVWIDDDEPYRFRLESSTGALRWQRDGITNSSGSVLRSVTNIAALKLISGSSAVTTIVDVAGYYSAGDGGGGRYRWDSASTATDNGGTVIKATAFTTGRWKLMHDNSVNVLQFGARADGTNDGIYIQAAVSSGVPRIVFSSDHYLTSTISVPSDTSIEWLDGASVAYDGTNTVFYSSGSRGTLRALASSVSKGDISFTVGAGLGVNFTAGGMAWIQSEADALGYAGHKKAELVIVQSIAGDVITVQGAIADSYLTTDTAKAAPVTPVQNVRYVNPRIHNNKWATATTIPTSSFIRGDFCRNFSIDGGLLYQNNGAAVASNNCIDFKISGVTCRDLRDDTANSIFGYGIEVSYASAANVISCCTFERCRHGVTTGTAGSGPTPNYGVQRGITVAGNTAIDCTHASFDTHEDSDGVTISGNTVTRGAVVGIATRSYRTTITGNTITGVAGNGIYCDSSSLDTTISGNTVSNCRKTDDTVNGRGHGIYITGPQTIATGNMVSGCDNFGIFLENTGVGGRDVLVSNNTIMSNGANRSTAWKDLALSPCTAGIYIKSAGNRIDIIGNHISDGNAIKTQLYGIWAGVISATGEGVIIANNTCSGNGTGPWLNESGKTLINFHGNNPYTMPGHTRRVDTSTGPIATTTESTVSVNFGVSLDNSRYDISHAVVGTNLELRNVSAVGVSGYSVKCYNRDGVSAQTGTIRTSITTRE